jgi:hypothetical protein
MSHRPSLIRCLYMAGALSAGALATRAAALTIEPLPGSPFLVGNAPLSFASDPARPILFGFTPDATSGSIQSYVLEGAAVPPFAFPAATFHPGALVQNGVVSPAGDLLYGGAPDGVRVMAIDATGGLSDRSKVVREGLDARPLKGLAHVTAAGGSFVYVNENTFPVNHVATYRVLDGGDLAFAGSVATGDGGNYAGGGAAAGIPAAPRIGHGGGRLFVLNGGSARVMGSPKYASVSVFDVGDDGRLAAVAGSPFFTPVFAHAMLVRPDGRALWLGTQATPTAASVVRFDVDEAGRLSAPSASYGPLGEVGGGAVNGFALHPGGRYLAASLYLTSHLAIVDLEAGETTRLDLPAANGPSADVAFDAAGEVLYVGTGGGSVAAYRLGDAPRPPQVSCVGAPDAPAVLVAVPGACAVTVDGQNGLAGSCAPGQGEAVACSFDGSLAESLGLGEHAVAVHAASSLGPTAQCTSFVRVVERDPPALSLAPAPAVLWPPDHRMVPVDLGLAVVDACDPAPAVTCTATSSEPGGADVVWDGATLSLRAERSGGGPGRTYSIACTATDASGNAASTSAAVVVPHDLGLR